MSTVDVGTAEISEDGEQPQLSLATAAARNLTTTTKTVPQMEAITSRWLLRVLPWVQVQGGAYRVNRRLSYAVGGGRLSFAQTADEITVVPPSLREVPLLAGLDDDEVLEALAGRFVRRDVEAGEVVTELGQPADQLLVVVHGRVNQYGPAQYEAENLLDVLADGDHVGSEVLVEEESTWGFTATAVTATTLLALPRQDFQAVTDDSAALQAQVAEFRRRAQLPQNRRGEADVAMVSGHAGEPDLPGTFVDYEVAPREYELSVAQTVLRIHTRVADLYNEPMNQVEQQLRLTVEALRERQEHEMVNNQEFGLLHNAHYSQRFQTHSGPPTPDDMDELLSRRRSTRLFLAHPRAIAAFGRECNRRGIYPDTVEVEGNRLPAWRGVPIYPCNKVPITDTRTSYILAMRTGEDDQGVVGLHQAGIPDEIEPSLNARFMGISEKGIISYLVSAYFTVAVLVPDALGVLDNVEISTPFS